MHDPHSILLITAMAVISFLYAGVGHGGASGYLAVMALAGFLPNEMKPTALALNLVTSSVASLMFFRAGHFSARIFLPLAAASVPFAFLGGRWTAPSPLFHDLVAFTLAVAAVGLIMRMTWDDQQVKDPSILPAILIGGGIGFLSGLVGVGGGIFLTPLMLFLGWCRPKTASAVSAPFILVNSAAGLCGNTHSITQITPSFPWFAAAVLIAGSAGAFWGSGMATNARLRQALAAVLAIAAVKMVVTV